MATLNLSKMKHMSEANLRKFASLIISLSSQVTDIENKCIKPYVNGELYPRDSYVSYNGYIYQATATNQDSAFDETHWDKLSDDFNELTVADIEGMLGLSQEQLETMANLIADTEVRLDKTYSSSKIYQDIQQCLNDSKSYTLKEIAKLNGSSYKVVTSASEMTSESIIYLLASGNTYDMYIVEENGATTKIGNMDVNLDNYFTKAEIEADYLKKADADGKYATITTMDGKVDKDKIVTALDDSVTDEQVASALLTKTELDKLSASLGEKASKEEIKNFKNVYNSQITLGITIENGQDNTRKVFDALGVGERYYDYWSNSSSASKWGIAESYGNTVQIEIVKVGLEFGVCTAMTNKGITLQRYIDTSMATMPAWRELATMDKVWTTEIADVPKTVMVSENTNVKLNSNCCYTVINGVCYVSLWGFTCTEVGQYVVNSSMPKTILTMNGLCTYGTNGYEGGTAFINHDDNKLYIEAKVTDETLYGSFSYPVSEE